MDKCDIDKLEQLGYVADSIQVRKELVSSIDNNPESLATIQKKLKDIQKTAKKNGLFTREQLSKACMTLEDAILLGKHNKIRNTYEKLLEKLPPRLKIKRKKI